jgi:ribosome maturation protein SDO1
VLKKGRRHSRLVRHDFRQPGSNKSLPRLGCLMVSLDDAVVARLARFGTTFEILVDPECAEKLYDRWDAAPDEEIREMMAIDDVFVDWSEGERAKDEDLMKSFETKDALVIARRIVKEGDIQLTQEQRKKMLEQKERRIVTTLARETWNPQARMPHPKERIERALEEAKFKVDPLRPVSEQVQQAFKALRPLLPIAFERVKVAIKIPAEHTGAAYGVLRTLGEMQREEWQSDGSFVGVIEMPAGAQGAAYDRLNGLTQGSVETKLL